LLVLLVVGVALVVLGAVLLVWKPLLPGGTIKAKWVEVSSAGAGLPLIVLGVATIVIAVVNPFDGGEDDVQPPQEAATSSYFEEFDGARGRIWFEEGAALFEARHRSRRLVGLARVGNVDRFRVRATYVAGASDYGVGLVCRHEQAGRYYVLAIASDGRYTIGEYENGELRPLVPFEESGVVDARANTLEARCEGEGPVILTLLVNGSRVGAPAVDTETPITRGGIGLRVGTPSPPVRVRFDGFQLLD
jgi:hypothetical protein